MQELIKTLLNFSKKDESFDIKCVKFTPKRKVHRYYCSYVKGPIRLKRRIQGSKLTKYETNGLMSQHHLQDREQGPKIQIALVSLRRGSSERRD